VTVGSGIAASSATAVAVCGGSASDAGGVAREAGRRRPTTDSLFAAGDGLAVAALVLGCAAGAAISGSAVGAEVTAGARSSDPRSAPTPEPPAHAAAVRTVAAVTASTRLRSKPPREGAPHSGSAAAGHSRDKLTAPAGPLRRPSERQSRRVIAMCEGAGAASRSHRLTNGLPYRLDSTGRLEFVGGTDSDEWTGLSGLGDWLSD
jgi:hypothetical protein